jgi:hypothetical protein
MVRASPKPLHLRPICGGCGGLALATYAGVQLHVRASLGHKSRFPVIDAHNHLAAPYGGAWDEKPLSELLDVFDEANLRKFVDLDGGWGETLLQKHLDFFKAKAPERFQIS